LRRSIGETIQAALLYSDLRGFTALSESNPPSAVISALDAWFDRIAGPVHAFGGEALPRCRLQVRGQLQRLRIVSLPLAQLHGQQLRSLGSALVRNGQSC